MSKKLLVVVAVLVLCIANLSPAPPSENAYFDNAGNNGLYNDAANWETFTNPGGTLISPRTMPFWTSDNVGTNVYPGNISEVLIQGGDVVTARGLIDSRVTVVADVVNQTGGILTLRGYWFGEGGGGATYNISGGTLDVLGAFGDALVVGQNYAGSTGDGTLNVSGTGLVIGRNGGLQIALGGGSGLVDISGNGVVHVPDIDDFSGRAGAVLNISGDGRLVLDGNKMSYLQPGGRLFAAIGNGKMKANGVGGGIQSAFIKWYDSATDTTIVKVPEPATIALLGMGAMALIRRKR